MYAIGEDEWAYADVVVAEVTCVVRGAQCEWLTTINPYYTTIICP